MGAAGRPWARNCPVRSPDINWQHHLHSSFAIESIPHLHEINYYCSCYFPGRLPLHFVRWVLDDYYGLFLQLAEVFLVRWYLNTYSSYSQFNIAILLVSYLNENNLTLLALMFTFIGVELLGIICWIFCGNLNWNPLQSITCCRLIAASILPKLNLR